MRALLRKRGRLMDATLVSLLAYAGLRPGKALALRWDDVRSRRILVQNALALGEVKDTKTRRTRSVRLLARLAADLSDWRDACGDPDGTDLVFPRADGAPWSDYDCRNWRKRVFHKTARPSGSTFRDPTTSATRSYRCSSPRAGPWSTSQRRPATRPR